MSSEIEIEKTFLAKYLPADLNKYESVDILDVYVPKKVKNADIRIRKRNNIYTITKKSLVPDQNAGTKIEENIIITEEEFKALSKSESNKLRKKRYYYPYKGNMAEIDIFTGNLKGLVLVDFEFKNHEEMNKFIIPDFCLADVTEEIDIAGGVLCHSNFSILKRMLDRFSYKKII